MLKEILCTCYYCFHDWVLILILMEHAQRVTTNKTAMHVSNGLNPYFNGTCSKSMAYSFSNITIYMVLILILMEHAQRGCIMSS